MVNFESSQLVGLMQYLALYWQDMRKTVEKMDDSAVRRHRPLHTKRCSPFGRTRMYLESNIDQAIHLENYVLLSNLLTQMGVISPNVADKVRRLQQLACTRTDLFLAHFDGQEDQEAREGGEEAPGQGAQEGHARQRPAVWIVSEPIQPIEEQQEVVLQACLAFAQL